MTNEQYIKEGITDFLNMIGATKPFTDEESKPFMEMAFNWGIFVGEV